MITLEQLKAIAPSGDADILANTAKFHNQYATTIGINSPLREAHFLAQLAHESAGFRTTVEYGGKDTRYAPWYGRGLIQITWQDNYKKFTIWASAKGYNNPDFVANRELVAQFPWAYLGALYYWDTHSLNTVADSDDVVKITKIINGGTNGLDSRKEYLIRAKKVLGLSNSSATPQASGPSLLNIQNKLISQGYRITADGKSGPETTAAIRVFQKLHGLTPDGVPGPKTLAVLFQ